MHVCIHWVSNLYFTHECHHAKTSSCHKLQTFVACCIASTAFHSMLLVKASQEHYVTSMDRTPAYYIPSLVILSIPIAKKGFRLHYWVSETPSCCTTYLEGCMKSDLWVGHVGQGLPHELHNAVLCWLGSGRNLTPSPTYSCIHTSRYSLNRTHVFYPRCGVSLFEF